MANADNLTKHRFTSEKQPNKRRSRKGIPNRATILKRLLRAKVTLPAHLVPGRQARQGTLEEHVALALIGRALRGNVQAIREILDTVYGKVKDQHEITGQDILPITIIQPTVQELKAQWEEERQKRLRQVEELDDDGP